MRLSFEFARKKLGWSLLICYLSVFIVASIKKIILLYFGAPDISMLIYQLMSSLDLNDLLPLPLFILGSFTLTFLYPLLITLLVVVYGVIVQFLIFIFHSTPARLSTNVSILLYAQAHTYPLKLIPILGDLLYVGVFLKMASKELAKENEFSTFKGVILLCSPFLVFLIAFMVIAVVAAGFLSTLLQF